MVSKELSAFRTPHTISVSRAKPKPSDPVVRNANTCPDQQSSIRGWFQDYLRSLPKNNSSWPRHQSYDNSTYSCHQAGPNKNAQGVYNQAVARFGSRQLLLLLS